MGHSFFEPEKTGSLLFELKKSETLLIRARNKLIHSYIEPENRGLQLFGAQKYFVTAI